MRYRGLPPATTSLGLVADPGSRSGSQRLAFGLPPHPATHIGLTSSLMRAMIVEGAFASSTGDRWGGSVNGDGAVGTPSLGAGRRCLPQARNIRGARRYLTRVAEDRKLTGGRRLHAACGGIDNPQECRSTTSSSTDPALSRVTLSFHPRYSGSPGSVRPGYTRGTGCTGYTSIGPSFTVEPTSGTPGAPSSTRKPIIASGEGPRRRPQCLDQDRRHRSGRRATCVAVASADSSGCKTT